MARSDPQPSISTVGQHGRFGRAALAAGRLGVWIGVVLLAIPLATAAENPRKAKNLETFDRVWNTIARSYFDETFNGLEWTEMWATHRPKAEAATSEEALYDAINEMLDKLDDGHTHALSPTEAKARKRREGVLIGLRMSDIPDTPGHTMVIDILPGGSAEEAGVKRGWILATVNGTRPDDVLGFDKLTEGQVVNCRFLDADNEPRELALTARKIAIKPVTRKENLDDGIVYLRFDKFETASARWLRKQLKEHRDARGVILDLRFNSGGDAAALGRSLGEFFTYRADMGRFITRGGENEQLHAWRWFTSSKYSGPLVVLLSHVSASSSEIFASVVKYHERAVIVGQKSDGVVLAARFRKLPGGGLLGFSVLDYIAPDGTRLEKTGVEPDVYVETTREDIRTGTDPAIRAAVAALTVN